MYTYEGFEYTEEEIQQAAGKANLSVKDYINKNNITLKDTDPDPKKAKSDAQGVDAELKTPQEKTPVEAPDTASKLEDTSLESPDPKEPFFPPGYKKLMARKNIKTEKLG